MRQFSHTEFLPLTDLVDEKQRKGLKLSLVIPALNEASTIGEIVAVTRRALVDEVALLDEIIVMDGDSTDGTFGLAAKAGARVLRVDEVPGGGRLPPGKGTALWKSLLVSQGDIVACIDADIANFDPRFVYGLVGPLIRAPELLFVKAFYERPLEMQGAVLANQGGRVTEILVRPLLSTFYPELAQMRQPLAGEYAFRRGVVEHIAFFSGYGVEIGLILDVFAAHGFSCFAEVDMGVRRHRNRDVRDLGKMAFGILQAMLKKLERHGRASLDGRVATVMVSPGGAGGPEKTVIEEIELPSVASFRPFF